MPKAPPARSSNASISAAALSPTRRAAYSRECESSLPLDYLKKLSKAYEDFLEDISQITQKAQQLKLASLGRLTASIAHEIRNPLGAISHAALWTNPAPRN